MEKHDKFVIDMENTKNELFRAFHAKEIDWREFIKKVNKLQGDHKQFFDEIIYGKQLEIDFTSWESNNDAKT